MDDCAHIIDFLRRGRWFGGLDPALQRLIVERGSIVRFRPGERLAEEGLPAIGLFAVLEGYVRVVRRITEGVEVPVHVAGPGFWTGEYATLTAQPIIGSIVADTRVRALLLSSVEFERIVEEDPRRFRAFLELMLDRYPGVYQSVAELQGLPSEALVAKRLASLARMWRDDLAASGPVDIRATQAELAAMLGLSRQRLSTMLHRLQAKGQIEVRFRSIRVLA